MQIASRQVVWNRGGKGTVIEVEMTPDTGLYLKFRCNAATETPVSIRWGDGADIAFAYTTQDIVAEHRYAAYGRYKVVFEGARSIGLRNLDGETQYSFDNAIISFVVELFIIFAVKMGLGHHSGNITVGVVMLLISGIGFTNGISNLLHRDTLSGVINMSKAVLGATGIAIGIALPILIMKGVM